MILRLIFPVGELVQPAIFSKGDRIFVEDQKIAAFGASHRRGDGSWISGCQKQQSPRISTRASFCMVPAPDERYVSARLGFPGVWSSLENSAYPN